MTTRLLAAAAVVVLLAVAVVDWSITRSRVPPLPPQCASANVSCNTARNVRVQGWADDVRALGAGYRARLWLYDALALAALAIAAAATLRSASLPEARRFFADVGVFGVVLLIVIGILVWVASSGRIVVSGFAAFAAPVAFLAVAALGGMAVRARQGAPPAPPQTTLRRLALGGLVATAATIALAVSYGRGQPACGRYGTAPSWIGPVAKLALVSTLAAFAFALVALATRRWVLALACVAVNPAALVYMAASSCAFY